MAFTSAAKEAAALAVAALGNSLSVHAGDPGTTGANEATGGSPAYARKTTTWAGGAVDGAVPGSPVSFDVPAVTSPGYTHLGQWNGSTFVASWPLSSATGAMAGQSVLTVTPSITVA